MKHNHFTRDVKAPGKCPACDVYNRSAGLMPPRTPRCKSRYQNANAQGEPLGKLMRCTDVEGHDDMHRNFRPGHKTKWPESAAMSEAPGIVNPPIPEELCGVRGIASETRSRVSLGGGCVFLKGHYELEGQEKHSWQQ